jgi:competence protein ComEA
VEPSATPPWRALDAPAGAGAQAGAVAPATPEPAAERSVQFPLTPTALKVAATAGGALVCAMLAFVLAFSSGSGEPLTVEGGSALPVAGGSADGVEPGGIVVPSSAGGEVVVEIVGAVPRPGVFRLPVGARVGDLVAAAGGYGPRVDTARAERELNLAATLHDGDQVRVPSRDDAAVPSAGGSGSGSGSAGSATGGGTAGAPVDINNATQAELEELPGIGPATAEKIIAAREEAPFAAVEELRTRGVLGEKTFEKLRELVTVH